MPDPTNQSVVWHTLTGSAVEEKLATDPAQGLSSSEVQNRLQQYGSNVLTKTKKEPFLKAFLRQYQDYMRLVLLAAAVASFIIGDYTTAILLFLITVGNALMGLNQEKKAADSVESLRKMMKMTARARRDGHIVEIEMDNVVPGDIVVFEAGDRVPADGRLFIAATLEIEEAALTGESTPVLKETAAIEQPDLPLGDRINMAYMNSSVTRGRGEMVVTGTGMDTEVGNIAGMLQATEEEKSPLTKQVDDLTVIIAAMAGIALVAIILIGRLGYDAPFNELYLMGIALAIAAIPTALPVVVTMILSIGTTQMAKQNAVVKRLPAVETLGSTSAICSDKTGTLTLNQMTARELLIAGYRYDVSGEGYDYTTGQIRHVAGAGEPNLDPFLLPMVLCSDAEVRDGNLVGDPTEGALVVLAQKGGVTVQHTRAEYPRIAEVPFDSAYKFMATFHNITNGDGRPVVRCYVKGAPDVIIGRATNIRGPQGKTAELNDEYKQKALEFNDRLASQGMRVMVVAQRDFDPASFDPDAELLDDVNDLTLLAMAGIVDPARPEAKVAIAECHSAGIRVRMITGDHAVTAAAIATELGIEGRAITGAEWKKMSDQEASDQIEDIGVIARVAPEDKIRLVSVLQKLGNIVAMTGDGVNDAPALKKADIGIAMGITGTDVSKDAATMILTDDNFATIVGAVEYGRVIYDNLMKYIRFQMAGLFSFILAFLGAAVFGVTLVLFAPFQILFVNYFIQGSIGASFALDTPTPGLMERTPRPANDKIMKGPLAIRLILIGLTVAACTIVAYQWTMTATGSMAAAQSMAMVMFSMLNIPFSINLRNPTQTAFSAQTFSNKYLLLAYGWVVFSLILATEIGLLQRILGTVSLSSQQWAICFVAALALFFVGEIFKLILRTTGKGSEE